MFGKIIALALALPALAAGPIPPTFRLPDSARPLAYALELTIVPEKEVFEGVVDIDTQVMKPSDVLWLNATGLTIKEAAFTPQGGKAISATHHQAGEDFLGLTLTRRVQPGRGLIHIKFAGPLSRKSTHGLFTQKDEGHWYAYSQFESTYARQAFPCFDEPGFKVPWKVTLRVPKDEMAVSNAPSLRELIGTDGLKTVHFATTKPLPTYLVAIGVGPFEVVDAGRAGKKGTPLRIIVPQGHVSEASYAAEIIPELFTRLENYFGIPYPYEKLDSLVFPESPVCMENAGLITYGQTWFLAKSENLSISFKRTCADIATHEMAHQWFGDLVTMAWWNDVWLNEAFATWIAEKIVTEWKPSWDGEVSRLAARDSAMNGDSLLSARMIRQPVSNQDDIENAFDVITYTKGSAVLSMFESFLGPDKFRLGVRRHLRDHAHGNATTKDFLGALAVSGGPEVPAAFSSFLDQSGFPLLEASVKPTKGRLSLTLDQHRFLPLGSMGTDERAWQIPLTLRYSSHGKEGRRQFLMKSNHMEMEIPIHIEDLDYLLINDGMKGYYRVLYSGEMLRKLLEANKSLTLFERIGLLRDVTGSVEAGKLAKGEAVELVPKLASDPNPHIVSAAARLAGSLKNPSLPEALHPNYSRFIQKYFGDSARGLGFSSKPGEEESTKLLRQTLIRMVAVDGEDPILRAQARNCTSKWLADRKAVEPDSVDLALGLSAKYGDVDLYNRFLEIAKTSKDKNETERLLRMLGSFDNPEIEKAALTELLKDNFDPRMSLNICFAGAGNRATQTQVLDFIKEHFDAIVARLPKEYAIYLVLIGQGFSDEKHRAEIEAFFKPRVIQFPGGPLMLSQVLETISRQEKQNTFHQQSIKAFLSKY